MNKCATHDDIKYGNCDKTASRETYDRRQAGISSEQTAVVGIQSTKLCSY